MTQEASHIPNQDLKLRVKGHLYEIQEVNDDVIGDRQGYPMAERGYQKTLFSVADCSDSDAVNEVAEFIKEKIQESGERPPNRSVRRKARQIVTSKGYPSTSYLNRA